MFWIIKGYKVELQQEGSVRLSSTFSDAEDASFIFKSGTDDSGTMQFVGGSSERIATLNRARQFYVVEKGSVPAFLASVTLEGWERQDIKS